MNTDLMFSTGKDDWATPPALFAELSREFRFTLDAAANSINHKCAEWLGPGSPIAEDGLQNDWFLTGGGIWINPPYSRGLQKKFIEKAAQTAQHSAKTIVMLLPARTDTQAFHEYIWDRFYHRPRPWVREVRFLKGRLRFVGAPASAPFPSMIVVFGS